MTMNAGYKWLQNSEVKEPGQYVLTRTDDGPVESQDEFVSVVLNGKDLFVKEKDGSLCETPIRDYDEECRWRLIKTQVPKTRRANKNLLKLHVVADSLARLNIAQSALVQVLSHIHSIEGSLVGNKERQRLREAIEACTATTDCLNRVVNEIRIAEESEI